MRMAIMSVDEVRDQENGDRKNSGGVHVGKVLDFSRYDLVFLPNFPSQEDPDQILYYYSCGVRLRAKDRVT